jgi:hypothetical protein
MALSHNKLRKLPGYLVHFANLKVLVVDHNPIEWPVSRSIGNRTMISLGSPQFPSM